MGRKAQAGEWMFDLVSELTPLGDQPEAIEALTKGVEQGLAHQILLGVTGSGKTFTMANVIANTAKSTLIIAPNKTLAAQLYGEMKNYFPDNAVGYFVSYYDYYQPEAYIPQSDTYIQKDSAINDNIDKLRHFATRALLDRDDVIIVSSVSCIYGLGSPEAYHDMLLYVEKGDIIAIENAIKKLVEIQYERGEIDFIRGHFRVRGDVLDIYPVHEEDRAVRICFFGDLVEDIYEFDPLTGKILQAHNRITIYPATHYVTTVEIREQAICNIKDELAGQVEYFRSQNKYIEAQRIEERTRFDLEMMLEIGYCHGIENYSRHLTNRAPGRHPPTLLDYFPKDFLVIIDESHIGIPQLNGMYRGDRSRKETLVRYGFRLPSALDNRPLKFEEFISIVKQTIYVSATPGPYELEIADAYTEQIIRPTGLPDPVIEIRPASNQVDELLGVLRDKIAINERVLITTLTKKMAEDLTEYYSDLGIKVRYMHSDIKTLERIEIIRDLRLGVFDVLVGINLLREGLDLPEVSLVAILDADKEGFLRSERSLIQTCGRAARNINGMVIFFADKITNSMQRAMDESNRRRQIQQDYNQRNNIIPVSIKKKIGDAFSSIYETDSSTILMVAEEEKQYLNPKELSRLLKKLRQEMFAAAQDLEFEKAASIRDQIIELEKREMSMLEIAGQSLNSS